MTQIDDESPSLPEEAPLTHEELAALKELYVDFIQKIGELHGLIDDLIAALAREEEKRVLDSWSEIKEGLEEINALALRLNHGEFNQPVHEQLQELLQKFSTLQEQVIAYEPKESREAKAKIAQDAYNKH